jgi:hypothetical protein
VKALLSDPAGLRTQDAHGRGDPAADVRAEQERVRLERKLAALDREVTHLVDVYQAEVIDLTELVERRRRIDDHGRMLRERVREIGHNGQTGPWHCGCSKGLTPFAPVSGGPWKSLLLRCSKRWYSWWCIRLWWRTAR